MSFGGNLWHPLTKVDIPTEDVCVWVNIRIYIYIERERDRRTERKREREREGELYVLLIMSIHKCISMFYAKL